MAEVPYGGVAQVTPETGVPHDYQNINATPEAFGGGIARGLEQAGAGAVRAADFYKQAVNNSAFNDAAKQMDYVLHGDPNKKIQGPDGSIQVDTGFFGKKGQDAMNSRASAEDQIEQIIQNTKQNLPTEEMQDQFESQIRRLQNQHIETIGAHTNQQANAWYQDTNKASSDRIAQSIAANPDDFDKFHQNVVALQDTFRHQVALEGGGAEQYKDADERAIREATRVRIESVGVKDPIRAQDMVEKNKDVLGEAYAPLALQVKSRADEAIGVNSGKQAVSAATSLPTLSRRPPEGNPYLDANHSFIQEAAKSAPLGLSADDLSRSVYLENAKGDPTAGSIASHGKYVGLMQIGPNEWKQYGNGDITDPRENLIGGNKRIAAGVPYLTQQLGRQPLGWEKYMIGQQGEGGIAKLLTNPNVRAGDLVGDSHISQNGGDPNAPAWMFTSMWRKKFNDAPIIPSSGIGNAGPSNPLVPTLGQTNVVGAPEISGAYGRLNSKETKQNALSQIMQQEKDGTLTTDQANHAYRYINNHMQIEEAITNQADKDKKALIQATANDFFMKIYDGKADANIISEINHSDGLGTDIAEKQRLIDLYKNSTGEKDQNKYGPGYMDAFNAIRNGQITQNTDLYDLGSKGVLSMGGIKDLKTVLEDYNKDPDAKAIQDVRARALNNLKVRANAAGTGADPENVDIFNSYYIPIFNSQLKQWTEDKKNPYDFYKPEKQEEIANMAKQDRESYVRIKTVKEMEEKQAQTEKDNFAKIPPPNVQPESWTKLLNSPITLPDNTTLPPEKVGQMLMYLMNSPDKNAAANVDDFLKTPGAAETILKALKKSETKPQPITPPDMRGIVMDHPIFQR